MGNGIRVLLVGLLAAGCASGADTGRVSAGSGAAGAATGDLVSISSDQEAALVAGACWGFDPQCDLRPPYRLELVVDASVAMTHVGQGSRTSWELVRDGLRAAISRPLPSNVGEAGALFFPNRATEANISVELPPSACINSADDVPIAPTDSSLGAIDSALARVEPNPDGGAPIQDAYRMAVDTLSRMQAGFQPVIVLVTDGHPTFSLGCSGTGLESDPVDPEPIIADITSARQAGIRTLVVGGPGSADARSWLSRAAREGGMSPVGCSNADGPAFCHIDMTTDPDLALGLFRSFAVPCLAPECTFPLTDAGHDPSLLNVLYHPDGGGTYLIPRSSDTSAACVRGWRLTELEPADIVVCHDTCDLVQSTYGRIVVLLGCAQTASP